VLSQQQEGHLTCSRPALSQRKGVDGCASKVEVTQWLSSLTIPRMCTLALFTGQLQNVPTACALGHRRAHFGLPLIVLWDLYLKS